MQKKEIISLVKSELFLIICLLISIVAVTTTVGAQPQDVTEIETIEMPVSEVLVQDAPTTSEGVVRSDAVYNAVEAVNAENVFEEKQLTMLNSDEPVNAYITTYGTDCLGCYHTDGFGGTASGVKLSFTSVRQSNGVWLDGITYDGYYVIAANSAFPFGSIVEVTNHGYSGMGLVPNQPFKAIVLDRGAMTINHIDLFVGSESAYNVSVNRSYAPQIKLVRYGY